LPAVVGRLLNKNWQSFQKNINTAAKIFYEIEPGEILSGK
jgi:hypothetical protein